jgi:enoyl-CoA hydratase/carnithine racemase
VIRTALEAGVWVVTLDRAQKRNALTSGMIDELIAAVEGTPGEARVVLLRGEGETFCAGFDLSACRDDDAALAAMLRALSTAVRTLRRLERPVVVAAQGAAVAGGCALLGGSDFGVTNDGPKLGYPVVRLGVSPAVSGPSLANHVGFGRARELMLNPSVIDGATAARMGLVHRSVPTPDEVESAAREIAMVLAAKPREGLVATKRWLNELEGPDRDGAMDAALERRYRSTAGRSSARCWRRRGKGDGVAK